MTTAFVMLGVPLLAVAGGLAGWRLYGRRRRAPAVAAGVEQGGMIPGPAGFAAPAEPAEPAATASTGRELLARMYATAFGQDPGDALQPGTADPAHQQVARAASAVLSRMEPGSRYAPRRPQLLPQLLNMVNDEGSSGREIAAIIARDPALAGNLLRIANSALYRVRPEPIDNIQRAVAMIGTDGLRQMIAVALMQPVMDAGAGALGRLPTIVWEHTLLSSVATAEHARQVERKDAFTAQMLGLLHGLGSIVVVQVVRDGYARHPGLAPDPDVVRRLLEEWSGRTARRLAQDWALSASIAPSLDDQRRDSPLRELSPLGRSLAVGRVAGAAAMLYRAGAIDVEAALVVLQQGLGLGEEIAAGVWERISRS